MKTLSPEYRERLAKLATCNISDALDKLTISGAALGIHPMYVTKKVIGRAVTVKMTAAGLTKSKHHLAIEAIDEACAGDVIVIDNGGRRDVSCWGEILGNAARIKGIEGVIIDGAARDIDDNEAIGFPVYARAAVPRTARGRIMQESYNCLIQLSGVQVRPGDIVMGDKSGVVVIPQERFEEVLVLAEQICEKEIAMVDEIQRGASLLEVDRQSNYERMLDEK